MLVYRILNIKAYLQNFTTVLALKVLKFQFIINPPFLCGSEVHLIICTVITTFSNKEQEAKQFSKRVLF